MEEFDIRLLVATAGLTLGILFGVLAERTRFCAAGGIADFTLSADSRRFRGWMLAIATGLLGAQAMQAAGLVDLAETPYLSSSLSWLAIPSGGMLFGFGMAIAGGCGSRTLIRMSSGSLRSLVVFLIFAISAYATQRGLLGPARLWLESATAIDLQGLGIADQGLHSLAAAALGIEAEDLRWPLAGLMGGGLLIWCFTGETFRRSPPDILGGLGVGLLLLGGWWITGVLGRDEFEPTALQSLSFVAPMGESLQYVMTFTGAQVNFGISLLGGIIAGALMMGVGGVLAMGCTIGQGVTGLSTLGAGSLLALLFIIAGGILGVRYRSAT